MAYSDFTYREVIRKFNLRRDDDSDLLSGVPGREPSALTRTLLDTRGPDAVRINSESARSHLLIMPLLFDAREQAAPPAAVLPGVTFEVDRAQGLNGYCDFLLTRSQASNEVEAPVVAVVEAKNEDIPAGWGQCAATMVAVRLFNEKAGTPLGAVHGCVTNGTDWQFLRLQEGVLSLDRRQYFVVEADKLVGIFVHLLGGPRPAA